jgi:hypothetical protein
MPVPAAAGDRSPYRGPLEIRIFGADGAVRDFLARSAPDQRGAVALVNQIDGAIEGMPRAIEESAVMLPHYRIEVSQLGPAYVTAPWARLSETSFIYFPGGADNSFMVVEYAHGRTALDQRWVLPDPEVAALLGRHLDGLRPIGLEPPTRRDATVPWNLMIGTMALAGIALRLLADRRRRWNPGEKGALEKGTNQRSLTSAAGKLPAA